MKYKQVEIRDYPKSIMQERIEEICLTKCSYEFFCCCCKIANILLIQRNVKKSSKWCNMFLLFARPPTITEASTIHMCTHCLLGSV